MTSRKLRERLFAGAAGATSASASRRPTSTDTFRVTRPRRAAARDPDRDHAPRGLRAAGVEADRRLARASTARSQEPIELLLIDVPEDYIGVVTQLLGVRRGMMTKMDHAGSGPRAPRVRRAVARPDRLPLALPHRHARHRHHERALRRLGAVARRRSRRAPTARWSSDREGVATPYAIFHLQERGMLFIPPGTPVYEGMVVGEYSRDVDLDVNVCREKKLTNMRASGPRRGRPPHAAPRRWASRTASSGSTTTSWSRSRPTPSGCASASCAGRSGPVDRGRRGRMSLRERKHLEFFGTSGLVEGAGEGSSPCPRDGMQEGRWHASRWSSFSPG